MPIGLLLSSVMINLPILCLYMISTALAIRISLLTLTTLPDIKSLTVESSLF